ncbi:unnamed protein product [Ixodes hexagonus]
MLNDCPVWNASKLTAATATPPDREMIEESSQATTNARECLPANGDLRKTPADRHPHHEWQPSILKGAGRWQQQKLRPPTPPPFPRHREPDMDGGVEFPNRSASADGAGQGSVTPPSSSPKSVRLPLEVLPVRALRRSTRPSRPPVRFGDIR